MDKKKVMDYVFHSIHNTNPMILSQMLDELVKDGGGMKTIFVEGTLGTNKIIINEKFSVLRDLYLEGNNLVLHLPTGDNEAAPQAFYQLGDMMFSKGNGGMFVTAYADYHFYAGTDDDFPTYTNQG